MPNGHPDFEHAERSPLDAFFAPMAAALEGFAQRFNLRLMKYYHGGNSWDFEFRHPQGGIVTIQVLQSGEQHVRLASSWSLANFETFSRSTFQTLGDKFDRHDPELLEALGSLLRFMVALTRDRLVPTGATRPLTPRPPRPTTTAVE
jgi:hypothetical protein